MQSQFSGPDGTDMALGLVGMLILMLVVLAMLALTVIIWWRIFAKAGWSGALGLLMLIPLANLVMLLILAFAKWPIQREVETLKAISSGQR
jgi:hypothetical protein